MLDACAATYRAHCPTCKWDGDEYDDLLPAVMDCRRHDTATAHAPASHRGAHVRVVRHCNCNQQESTA